MSEATVVDSGLTVGRYWIDHCIGVARDAGNIDAAQDATKELEALRTALTESQQDLRTREGDIENLRRISKALQQTIIDMNSDGRSLKLSLTAAEKRAQEADSDCEKALKERDEAVEMCDKLAARIADMDDLDIGEHSSGNCPWQNALDGISQEPT